MMRSQMQLELQSETNPSKDDPKQRILETVSHISLPCPPNRMGVRNEGCVASQVMQIINITIKLNEIAEPHLQSLSLVCDPDTPGLQQVA